MAEETREGEQSKNNKLRVVNLSESAGTINSVRVSCPHRKGRVDSGDFYLANLTESNCGG